MIFHPSIHGEIARLRHQDLLAGLEHHPIEKAALSNQQDGRRRQRRAPATMHGLVAAITGRLHGARA